MTARQANILKQAALHFVFEPHKHHTLTAYKQVYDSNRERDELYRQARGDALLESLTITSKEQRQREADLKKEVDGLDSARSEIVINNIYYDKQEKCWFLTVESGFDVLRNLRVDGQIEEEANFVDVASRMRDV